MPTTSTNEQPVQPEESAPGLPARKPYTRPTLRRIGSVRELTQTGKSGNLK
jgi:hypothetical protein